ncbi:hypothetical protein BDP55DRAFT_605919 [Colletotrichum godetiae]|uniref:Indole-diterpene biosynthesis protein PaxU n=1 Tax=Colletotrichum godetiae TaxID=1209918 RepID=A0AAJ0ARI4_9PEZI|nr:uncharacterized protein BDP55DRAFT_605919 [Colletotrichum godetiae]KAK1688433.1 hypothetical protein BDP55DRAFT_605919 [Colletotrichum godetiae]
MASNQPAGAAGPLPAMQELSPTTFLYDPPSSVPDPNSPKLVAIFSWMSAQDVHIAKYTSRYMAMYPSASILLVKCPFIHTLSTRISKRQIKPAVPVIRSLADSTPPPASSGTGTGQRAPQLLFHVFSNGGATNLAKFLELYADADRAGRLELPLHVTLYDSCPGGFHWMRSYRALSASMPRILAPLAHVFIGWFWLFHVPLGRVGFFGKMWAALRQKALLGSERRRAYLYSKEDEMIYWGDVERHAEESAEAGFKVRKERFDGSQHVAHAKLDSSRYWGLVRDVWDGDLVKKKVEPPTPTTKSADAPSEPTPENGSEAADKTPESVKTAPESPQAAPEPQKAKTESPKASPTPEPTKVSPEPPKPAPPPPEIAPARPKRQPTPPPTIQ